jgi:hypothetical protein
MDVASDDKSIAHHVRNRFDRMEIAGAFGDLGTLIPFVVAYIGVLKMDPFGVMLSFGMAMVVCGFIYRTPMPVQPMKAVGAIAATQAAQPSSSRPPWCGERAWLRALFGSFLD